MKSGDRVYIGIDSPEGALTSGILKEPTTVVMFSYGGGDYSSTHTPGWVVQTGRGEIRVRETDMTVISV
jgi:hypothetical protein